MITNETRAKLIWWKNRASHVFLTEAEAEHTRQVYAAHEMDDAAFVRKGCVVTYVKPPSFDTDANAVAELRAFVRARGKEAEFCGHVLQIVAPTLYIGAFPVERILDLLSATPQQQCAAFDIVFKNELEKP